MQFKWWWNYMNLLMCASPQWQGSDYCYEWWLLKRYSSWLLLCLFFWTDAQLACKSRACVWTVGHQSIRAVIIIRSAMPRDFSTTQLNRPSQLLHCWGESSWSQRKCHKAPSVCRVSPRPSRHSDSHTGGTKRVIAAALTVTGPVLTNRDDIHTHHFLNTVNPL